MHRLLEWSRGPPSSRSHERASHYRVFFRPVEDASSMPEIDAEMLVDQVTMLGLVSREQLHEATPDAEDGSPDSGAADAAAQGLAHELADRPAQEGRPQRVLLRRLQGALPPGGGDVRAGLSRRAYHDQGGPGDQGAAPAVRHDSRRGRPVPQGGRGRHEAAPSQHRPGHRCRPARKSALHDHGIRRGNEPPRFHEAPHPHPARAGRCR